MTSKTPELEIPGLYLLDQSRRLVKAVIRSIGVAAPSRMPMTDSQNPPRRQACEEARRAAKELLFETVLERQVRSGEAVMRLGTHTVTGGKCAAGHSLDDEIPF